MEMSEGGGKSQMEDDLSLAGQEKFIAGLARAWLTSAPQYRCENIRSGPENAER